MFFSSDCMQGKTIVITGASSGIGQSSAILLGNLGANCALVARNSERLTKTRDLISKGNSETFSFDLSDSDKIADLVESIVNKLGKISGFVHCAGLEKTLPFQSCSGDDFQGLMDINFTSFWKLSQEITRKKNHEKGNLSVVAISSLVAIRGVKGRAVYSSTKGALTSLVRTLAVEYAQRSIRFNSVCPGFVDTPMLESVKKLYTSEDEFQRSIVDRHPLGIGQPEDVANAITFLLSDASSWITGTNIVVDGGYSAM